jgi:hypothetical protein
MSKGLRRCIDINPDIRVWLDPDGTVGHSSFPRHVRHDWLITCVAELSHRIERNRSRSRGRHPSGQPSLSLCRRWLAAARAGYWQTSETKL